MRHEVGGVHPRPFRVNAAQLGLIVPGQEVGLRHEKLHPKKTTTNHMYPYFCYSFIFGVCFVLSPWMSNQIPVVLSFIIFTVINEPMTSGLVFCSPDTTGPILSSVWAVPTDTDQKASGRHGIDPPEDAI